MNSNCNGCEAFNGQQCILPKCILENKMTVEVEQHDNLPEGINLTNLVNSRVYKAPATSMEVYNFDPNEFGKVNFDQEEVEAEVGSSIFFDPCSGHYYAQVIAKRGHKDPFAFYQPQVLDGIYVKVVRFTPKARKVCKTIDPACNSWSPSATLALTHFELI